MFLQMTSALLTLLFMLSRGCNMCSSSFFSNVYFNKCVYLRTDQPLLSKNTAMPLPKQAEFSVVNQSSEMNLTDAINQKFLEIINKKLDLACFFKNSKYVAREDFRIYISYEFHNNAVGFYVDKDGCFRGFYISHWFLTYLDLTNQKHANTILFALLHQFSAIYFFEPSNHLGDKYSRAILYSALELSEGDKAAAEEYCYIQDRRYLYYFDKISSADSATSEENGTERQLLIEKAHRELKVKLEWIAEYGLKRVFNLKTGVVYDPCLIEWLNNLAKY